MGNKIWRLSIHPRSFGYDKIVGTYVRPFMKEDVKGLTSLKDQAVVFILILYVMIML